MIRSALFLAGLLIATPVSAQAPQVRQVDSERDIDVSVRIESLDGEVLFDYDGSTPRVLASNTKLLTTAAALLELPADFRWQTTVYLEEKRLTLVASGDPSIRTLPGRDVPKEFLDSLAEALRQARMTKIDTLVLDLRGFGNQVRHPWWPQDQWMAPYAAGFSGLSIEGGVIVIRGKDGRVSVEPPMGDELKIERRLAKDVDRFTSYWIKPDEVLRVNGGPLRKREAQLAVEDPAVIFRKWLKHGLTVRGIEVGEPIMASAQDRKPSGDVFWTFESAWTLAEAVAVANLESDNFVSEAILKTLGKLRYGLGNYENGVRAVREILAETGMDLDSLVQSDGSGFARHPEKACNMASPALLCELLRTMAQRPAGQLYFDSLPIADRSGRLSRFFSDEVFDPQRVHAKTGWITGASSLSGYLLAPDGQPLVFSIVVNYVKDHTSRTNNARFRQLQAKVLSEVLRQWPTAGS